MTSEKLKLPNTITTAPTQIADTIQKEILKTQQIETSSNTKVEVAKFEVAKIRQGRRISNKPTKH